MALIEINRDPSRRELRWFGPLFLLFWGILGTVLWLQFEARTAAVVTWIAGGLVGALFLAVPRLRRPIYLGWTLASYPIGWVISHLVLAIVYYGVVTPVGIALRLSGRDALRRRPDPGASTYWLERRPADGTRRYFRQF